MGASLLLFLDSLTNLAEGDHADGGVEGLKRLHQVAILHQFGPCHEEGPAGLRGRLVRGGQYLTFANNGRLVSGKRVCQSLLLRSAQRPTREVC
jgi:hypothetical protein